MKKVRTIALGLALTLSLATVSFAQQLTDIPQINVLPTTDANVKLLLVASQNATGQVILKDNDGHVLYQSKVNLQNGLNQLFNLAELATGTYQLSVTNGRETTIKTFVVEEKPASRAVVFQS
jgi:hypothetical protein